MSLGQIGVKGPTGPTGLAGMWGVQGNIGPTGPRGPTGIIGVPYQYAPLVIAPATSGNVTQTLPFTQAAPYASGLNRMFSVHFTPYTFGNGIYFHLPTPSASIPDGTFIYIHFTIKRGLGGSGFLSYNGGTYVYQPVVSGDLLAVDIADGQAFPNAGTQITLTNTSGVNLVYFFCSDSRSNPGYPNGNYTVANGGTSVFFVGNSLNNGQYIDLYAEISGGAGQSIRITNSGGVIAITNSGGGKYTIKLSTGSMTGLLYAVYDLSSQKWFTGSGQ